MDKKLAIKDLRCVKRIFDRLDIKFWLMYGTALGAYRDGDFLPEERFDIDLGTFAVNDMKMIWEELEKKGFKRRKGWERCEYLLIERNVKFDLCFFHDEGNMNRYRCFARGCAPFHFSKEFGKFKKIKFYNDYYLIPSPTEGFLQEHYGNWQDKTSRKSGKI